MTQAITPQEQHDLRTRLEAEAKRLECVGCRTQPTVAWLDGTYKLRCACYPRPPAFTTPPDAAARRRGQLMAQQGIEALTPAEVRQYISPRASSVEAEIFIRFCLGQGLNPFERDAYLIKYDDRQAAAIVIGIAAYLKRASAHPDYAGIQNGVVVAHGDTMIERDGSLTLPGDTLIGGWARVHRRGWAEPLHHTVGMTEYDRKLSQWRERPATMIAKVALAQALRRAFPETMADLAARRTELVVWTEDAPEAQGWDVEAPALSTAQEDAPEPATEPEPAPERVLLATLGDLLNACMGRWDIPAKRVYEILGTTEPRLIRDFEAAYRQVEAAMEVPAPEAP